MTSLVTVAALMIIPLHTLGHDLYKAPIKVCGSALADYVALVCDGSYNLKRSVIRPLNDDSIEPEYYYNHEMFVDTDPYPFRSKRSVSTIMHPYRSKRQREVSIVHECCLKSCTRNELTGYCGQSNSNPQE